MRTLADLLCQMCTCREHLVWRERPYICVVLVLSDGVSPELLHPRIVLALPISGLDFCFLEETHALTQFVNRSRCFLFLQLARLPARSAVRAFQLAQTDESSRLSSIHLAENRSSGGATVIRSSHLDRLGIMQGCERVKRHSCEHRQSHNSFSLSRVSGIPLFFFLLVFLLMRTVMTSQLCDLLVDLNCQS